MKKILFLFLGIFILFSCSKENMELEATSVRQMNNSNLKLNSNCNDISDLCRNCLPIGVGGPIDGPNTDPSILTFLVEDNGVIYEITPQDYFSKSSDFVVRSDKNDFIITNSSNSYIQKKGTKEYPSFLSFFVKLNYDKLLAGAYSKERLEEELGVPIKQNRNGQFQINSSNFSDSSSNGGHSNLVAIPEPCGEAFVMGLMEDYYEVLGTPNTVISTPSVWMDNVDFYFEQEVDGINFRTECLSSKTIVDNIIAGVGANWSEQQITNLKLNYLLALLDLPEDIGVDLLGDPDFISTIFDMLGSENSCSNIDALISVFNQDCVMMRNNEFIECTSELLLEEIFGVNILEILVINGVPMGVDETGILHVLVDPIDISNSTDAEVLAQIMLVLNQVQLWFCETDFYEPINWRDYFYNILASDYSGSNISINLPSGQTCEFGFDIQFIATNSIMETSPNFPTDGGSGFTYTWTDDNSNFPILAILTEYNCVDSFIDYVNPDCEN